MRYLIRSIENLSQTDCQGSVFCVHPYLGGPWGQSAEALRVPMPLLSLLRDHLLQAIAQKGEDVDCSAMPPLLALASVTDSSSSHVSSLGADGLRAVA
jgi:hypothetical protein